ncbi:MAG: hypothetical protein A2452_10535 [Candidatus Firestonebacteria bacterium RIFOXYC2_FULL_39_67]|nr:MAG: hypothetical protein A2452_10535 [Candidatus Firestonebacteria bacterium RIFOXYC2_FULL_39_67]
MFTKEELNQIKKTVRISYVCHKLGIVLSGNSFQCFNPVRHNKGDHKSSCSIDTKRNKFKCFGCGVSGDNVSLVSQVLHINTDDALALIKGWISKEPDNNLWQEDAATSSLPELSPALISEMDIIYSDLLSQCSILSDTPQGKEFLCSKLISPEIAAQFNLRYLQMPQYNDVMVYLLEKYGLPRLQTSGLFNIKKDGRGNLRFGWKHNVLLPVKSNGKIVFMQGRTINPKIRVKYLNLPVPVGSMFNQDILSHLLPNSPLFLTEGALDCLTLLSHGFNAVGLFGATNANKLFLDKLTPFALCVAFDNDKAGYSGSAFVRSYFMRFAKLVHVLQLPPDFHSVVDLLRTPTGKSSLQKEALLWIK